MAKLYIKNTWQDEVLAGAERYNILENGGAAFKSNMQIALATGVVQAGSALDAARMNNIENGIDQLDTLLDTVNAMLQLLATGWVNLGLALTYASATSLTVVGDQRASFCPGAKLRLKQGGSYKHFYVLSATYAASNTTVTITGGSDYTLANAAITDAGISYDVSPQGFPDWFNWTPTLVGWSVVPPNSLYRFKISGRLVTVTVNQTGANVSNSTALTMTAPVMPATTPSPNFYGTAMWSWRDNSVAGTAAARVYIATQTGIITCNTNMGSGAWTASGAKEANFTMHYEM